MYVANLVEGQLYITSPNTIFRPSNHEYAPGKIIKVCNIWKGFPRQNEKRIVMVYLGQTIEDWTYYGVGKHRWFLIDGERVRVDGHHVKLIEELCME